MKALLNRLFGFRRSDYYIYLDPDKRPAGIQHFRRLLRSLQFYRGATFLIVRALGLWVIVLFLIYFALAYRPDLDVGASNNSDVSVLEQNRRQVSSFRAFTEYLARMTGAIPQDCAVAETDMKLPVKEYKDSAEPLPGLAFMVKLVDLSPIDGKDVEQEGGVEYYFACKWRSSPASLIAFISLDVGLIQKVTLLFLIIGLLWLRRSRLQSEIDRAAFPIDDPGLQPNSLPDLRKKWANQFKELNDNQINQERLDRSEHPITIIEREDGQRNVQRFPLYPVTYLGLDKDSDQNSEVRQYRICIEDIKRSMAYTGQTAPFDLILDVLDRGGSTGLAGEAENRLRVAVFEYGEKLAGRLWPAEYILWLLPTIGFLGTIYGISASLVRAKDLFAAQDGNPEKFAEDIGIVVDGLGVAFDTTSLALICATVLYFSLCSVRQNIFELTERARETLQKLLVRRMVDRYAIPKQGPPEDSADGPASIPNENGIDSSNKDRE